ncbi:MAG TPA: DUF2007 domain-containing protein [Thermoanaerobaculia bacterium]|nr:DUF2007 domain-containing protein [Thermoanaerobaculia bacterium]
MLYCPTCKQAFDEENTECPNDHVPLVEELPYQTIEGPTTTWVEIASVGTEDEANLLRGFLEAEGIPCQVESLRFSMEPITFGTMGDIRVYVAADSEATALELLSERRADYDQIKGEESVLTDEGPAEIDDEAQTVAEEEQ